MKCIIELCNKKAKSDGLCIKHYYLRRQHLKEIEGPKYCQVKGCENKKVANGYCMKHLHQIKRNGKTIRTRFDPNEFSFIGEVCIMKIHNYQTGEVKDVYLDPEDYSKVKEHKWNINHAGFVVSRGNGRKAVRIHRLILNPPDEHRVRHLVSKLDNRKKNLKIEKKKGRRRKGYKKIYEKKSSEFIGVSWHYNYWRARIGIGRKDISLGLFSSEVEAAKAYDTAALELRGEKAITNKKKGLL